MQPCASAHLVYHYRPAHGSQGASYVELTTPATWCIPKYTGCAFVSLQQLREFTTVRRKAKPVTDCLHSARWHVTQTCWTATHAWTAVFIKGSRLCYGFTIAKQEFLANTDVAAANHSNDRKELSTPPHDHRCQVSATATAKQLTCSYILSS